MKKIAANDSRQSVGLKWKTRKGLENLIHFEGNETKVVGDLKVGGNATFSDKNSFIWHGTITETIEGMTVTSNVSGLFFQGPTATMNGEAIYEPAIFALIATKSADGFNCYLINPVHYDPATEEMRSATVEEILSGNWSFLLSVNDGKLLINNNSDATLNTLDVNRLAASDASPAIDEFFEVTNKNITLGEIADEAKKVDWKSDAKYQHTVTIKGTRPAQGGGSCFLTFTAYSSNNTTIDSAQDLIDVFGGCDLSVSGMYSPEQGTNFGAIKLYLNGASTIADVSLAYIDPSIINEAGVKMSECGNLSFTDDVCVPK